MSTASKVQLICSRTVETVERAIRLMRENGDADDARQYIHDEGLDFVDFFTDEDDPDYYDESDMAETVREREAESVLEFYSKGKRYNGEWQVTSHVAVFGIGGPHLELSGDTVVCYWGGERAERYLSGADSYFEMVFGVED